ncbi:kinase-like domain-containing protein [Massariosphaeria phaeospora]|uniref:cyclin-dependent kinase n=1 Tax=Massariosphaeria phaeospora TaxID=100035 RepID=A0A7C8I5Y0_9PLEO|nr:kinase-like domain-containing protein [Massariosphaeria phaeospora]
MASRWATDEVDQAEEARRKQEKEEKKRLKLAKQQAQQVQDQAPPVQESESRPPKRRRLSPSAEEPDNTNVVPKEKEKDTTSSERKLLRFSAGSWGPSRLSSNFETLNAIEEGSYGWVSRARDISTGEIVALKKVKMDKPAHTADGFPITALREISILQRCASHPNIVTLREVLMDSSSSANSPSSVVLVMEFLEHDLKTLQEDMPDPFLPSEIKTLLRQLGGAVAFLHDNHILHRDLKTSNILLNNRGALKLADFGMSRSMPPPTSSSPSTTTTPPTPLTQLVVTLWYRAPELLLGTPTYTPAIDLWSLGCIFGELLSNTAILPGKNEVDQLSLILAFCGLPSEKTYPAFYRLPNARTLNLPRDSGAKSAPDATLRLVRARYPAALTAAGAELLASLLSLHPEARPSAHDLLQHRYFAEAPKPKPPELFPTFPSKAGQEKRRRRASPHAPRRGDVAPALKAGEVDFSGLFAGREDEEVGGGFSLKMG